MPESGRARDRLRELLVRLDGCAAGLWTLEGDALIQRAFEPGPTLPADVALAFALATRSVSLSATNLGIVGAALTRQPVISLAGEVPLETTGSSGWLRAFGAARSVAVPLEAGQGGSLEVLSVALASPEPDSETVIALIRAVGEGRGEQHASSH